MRCTLLLRPCHFVWLTLVVAISLAASACSEETDGPKPAVVDPAPGEPLPIDPGIVCNVQHDDPLAVVVHAERLSPMPFDIPDDAKTGLPEVSLLRNTALDGSPGDLGVIVFGGEPGQANQSLLTWQSQDAMTFHVVDSLVLDEAGTEGAIPAGVYDVQIRNPNGHAATSMRSFAVVDKPALAQLTPSMVCLEQGARAITLRGTTLLRVNDAEATFSVDGVTETFAIDGGGFADCIDIPHDGYATLQTCETATSTLAQDAIPVGYPAITVHNPATASCQSTDAINLRVVAAPVITAVAEVAEDQDAVVDGDGTIVSVAEEARQVVLHGRDFLEVDGALPSVTLDGAAIAVLSIGGACEDLPTMGLTVRRCTQVTVEIPTSYDQADPYNPILELTNPEPAGCLGNTSLTATLLTIAPDPVLTTAVPPAVCAEQGDRDVVVQGTGFLEIDGVLPTSTLDGAAFDVTGVHVCVDLDVPGKQVRRCDEATIHLPAGSIPVAEHSYVMPSIVVTNPAPAGGVGEHSTALTLLSAPTIESAAPPVVCNAQGDVIVVITGTGFIAYDAALPAVMVGGVDATVDSLDDCTDIPVEGATVRQCRVANVTIAAGSVVVPAGSTQANPDVVLTNPTPVGCGVTNADALTFVPPPMIFAANPPMACLSGGDRAVTLMGFGFLEVDGVAPTVDFNGTVFAATPASCTDLIVQGLAARSCAELTVTIPQDGLALGAATITVTNPAPADCFGSNLTSFVVVAPPTIADIQPPALCDDGTLASVTITGSDLLVVDGLPPTVTVNGAALAATDVTASGCTQLAVEGLTVDVCDTLIAVVDPTTAGTEATIAVENPAPAGCSDTWGEVLPVLAPPSITDATPALVCTDDGARQIVLTGQSFLDVGGVLPAVTFDGLAVTTSAINGCTPITLGPYTAQVCTELTVDAAQGSLTPGDTDVVVTNPAPLACAGSSNVVLDVPPSLVLASVSPAALCQSAGGTFTVQGDGFLEVDGALPTLTLGGLDFSSAITGLSGCTSLTVAGSTVSSCTGIDFTVAAGAFAIGDVQVDVTNPAPSGCAATATGFLTVTEPPTVSTIDLVEICAGDTGPLVVTGSSFVAATEAFFESGTTVLPATVTYIDTNNIAIEVPASIAPGVYDLRVSNGSGCESVSPAALLVQPQPLVFFIDPPVVYNGVAIDATIFTSGLNASNPANLVELVDASGTAIALTFSTPDRPNRIQASIPDEDPNNPGNPLAAGTYSVRVTSQLGCVAAVPGALLITDALTVAVESIGPSFVSPSVPTAVTITAVDPAPAGFVQFEATPRLYLNPNPNTGQNATALRAVVFESATQLTAVIPGGLAPGQYDLIVTNPSGAVGVLTQAVTVTAGEPPVVTAVVPSSLGNNSNQVATIVGDYFDPTGATIDFICLDPATSLITADVGTAVSVVDAQTITTTLPTASIAAGSICLVGVTNPDGASFTYSAVSVKNPSQNLGVWSPAAPLVEGRRALGLAAGRPTATSRYLYAVGGDDGTTAGAKSSVESVAVDVFGELGSWALQPQALPMARTQAATVAAGRFIYVLGGHDGVGATQTVLRSEVLDPLEGPEVVDVDALPGDGTSGLDGGLWYYRVSAIFPPTDAFNPSGESLPGEVLNVQLPALPEKLELALTWNPVPGASGYRVYRSPVLDAPFSAIELLVETSCAGVCDCAAQPDQCQFNDDGLGVTQGVQPLPSGSLGVWAELTATPMTTPREGAATVAFANPNNPNERYLYAFGGRDDTGAYLDTYEYTTITVDAAGRHTLGPWTLGGKVLGNAVADTAAWIATSDDSGFVPAGAVMVYVGTGRTDPSNATGNIYSGWIDGTSTSPELLIGGPPAQLALDLEAAGSQSQAAAGGAYGGGFLFLFGGENGNGGLRASDSSTAFAAGPVLNNWNSLGGGSMPTRRAFPGVTQESAFFFVVGGRTATEPATATVEQTVQ